MTLQVVEGPAPAPETPAARLEAAIGTVIRGKRRAVRLLLAALVSRGHVLVEDVPGVGKTTLARALAAALGGTFRRIQFTSDLLPSDILGVTVYDQTSGEFRFKPGPIFANVVLADEINRTSPRTQSSLMEVMAEGQVTVDSRTHPLEDPFIVVATQNPQEHFGTYPLPESQLDRFALRLTIGYPSPEDERAVVASRTAADPVAALAPVATPAEVAALQRQVDAVRVDDALLDYAMAVVAESRRSPLLDLGVSTRGAITWHRAARAHALVCGRDHCLPDDFKGLALPCLAHRVLLAGQPGAPARGRDEAERVLGELLDRVPVPL